MTTKSDWNERARDDEFRWVYSRAGSEAEFEASGIEDSAALMSDVTPYLPDQGVALEIGCGSGRLLPSMAPHFRELWGTDVSGEMLALARPRITQLSTVRLLETADCRLDGVPDGYFDFCYSAFTFEHIDDPAQVAIYINEARRVLKQGGIFKFQVAGLYPGNPFRPFYEARRNTWFGAPFTMAEIVELTERARFDVRAAYHARNVARPEIDGNLDVEHRIWVVACKGDGMDEWERIAWASGRAVASRAAAGDLVLAADGNMLDLLSAASGGILQFVTLPAPADSADGIATLEAWRVRGGRYLLVSRYKSWWFDHYPELAEHVARCYTQVAHTPDYTIVSLDDPGRL